MIVARHHKRQHYSVIFESQTGFFARIEDPGWPEPFWCEHGPELMDIGITNWCDRGCDFCYRGSDTNGMHMRLSDYRDIIRQASEIGVFQVALGGGNPNQHPQFEEIVAATRNDYGIVPSYTTNGRGLTASVISATRQHCGAVAVSIYPPYHDGTEAIKVLVNNGIKTNVHFILDAEGVDTSISWLENPPKWFNGLNAVIFLNFKPVTRNGNIAPLAKHNPRVGRVFELATTNEYPFKVGFDDCSTTGMLTNGKPALTSVEACDAARFSMFVSENMQAYPCSFMAELCEGHKVTATNLQNIWMNGKLFTMMRKSLSKHRCNNCSLSEHCMSGCPLFPDINICDSSVEETDVQIAIRGDNTQLARTSNRSTN